MINKLYFFVAVFCAFSFQTNAQAFQWAKKFDSHNSFGTHIVADNAHNIISVGWFHDSVDVDPGPAVDFRTELYNGNSAYISKLDATGNFVWGATFNTSSFHDIAAVDVDSQDNIIVFGHFSDSIDMDFGPGTFWLHATVSSNNLSRDIFIAKYSPTGNFIWAKVIHRSYNQSSTTGNLWCRSLKVDHNDDVILLGSYGDTVDFDPGPAVSNLVSSGTLYAGRNFLLKLDAAGNFVWVRDWKSSPPSHGYNAFSELDVDASNNIFTVVMFGDTLDIDPSSVTTNIYSQGQRDVCLLKIFPNGSLDWYKQIGGSNQEWCHTLSTDRWGNIYYVIGTQSPYLDMDPGFNQYYLSWSSNGQKFPILKLDNDGNFIWARRNVDHGECHDISTDTLGGICLINYYHPSSNVVLSIDIDPGVGVYNVTRSNYGDIIIQNFSSVGDFVWGGLIGGPGTDRGRSICVDKLNGVYCTGNFNQTADLDPFPTSYNMTNFPNASDGFVVKLASCNKYSTTLVQACDSVVYGSQVYYQDTVIQNYYAIPNGCDSASSIVIDVKTLTNDTIHVDACQSYFWNGAIRTTNGYYTHNYGAIGGCDSIITLHLSLHYDSVYTLNPTSCQSITMNGITYTQTGLYQQNYNSVFGCDSNFIINFTLVPNDTSITILSINSLQANAASATYQWMNCAIFQPIVGQTSALFTATQSGLYACIITQNGCADTSSCYYLEVWPDAIAEHSIVTNLYPNPSAGSYQLELDKNYTDVNLEIRTISGQLIWTKNFTELKQTTLNIDRAAGVYMLYIKQGQQMQVKKLLKW